MGCHSGTLGAQTRNLEIPGSKLRFAPNDTINFVMPGHSSLCADCVNLSAMPGIHVLVVV
jgi:hypothetical protein